MERFKGLHGGPFDTKVEIVENGVRYLVDVEDGQKTGFSWTRNTTGWQSAVPLPGPLGVLDCFTHTGSFALNAGLAGRSRSLAWTPPLAVDQATENAALNGLEDRVVFLCADVFDLLPPTGAAGGAIDVVILDPPAFTKVRSSMKQAVKGYREINLRGLKLVRDGAIWPPAPAPTSWTRSCSPRPSAKPQRRPQAPAAGGVPHPGRGPSDLWAAEESYYLKFYIFQVCDEK